MLLLWAYMHAMQYIIIWAGNIPDEVSWYVVRSKSGWGLALWVLFLGQFILPFFALLSARVRTSTRALIALSAITMLLRYLEFAVLILPPLDLPRRLGRGIFGGGGRSDRGGGALAWRTIGQFSKGLPYVVRRPESASHPMPPARSTVVNIPRPESARETASV